MPFQQGIKFSTGLAFLAAAILLINWQTAEAADYYWAVSEGDWSTPENWGGNEPTDYDNAYIQNGGTVTVNQSGEVCSYLVLGSSGSGNSGTVEMTGGSLNTTRANVGDTGVGTFSQSAGTNTVSTYFTLGSDSGSNGTYNLSGTGQLIAQSEDIGSGGTGTFNHTAGTNTVSGYLTIGIVEGVSGTYNLSGTAQLNARNEEVGCFGKGTFDHSAGTNTISDWLFLGYDYLGYPDSNGIYNLYGTGQLISHEEYIGENGKGIFTHSAGTNNVALLYLGHNAGAIGTYNLNETGQLFAAKEYIGYSGSGTFTQSGGINTVSNQILLGWESGSSGTYNLIGGTLILKSIVNSGTSAFNFGGGMLRASGDLFTILPMTLTGINGNANLDSAGYTVGLYGVLSGTGGLNKLGAGTLTLGAKNTYSGNTTINGGTLVIAGGIDASGTSLIDVQSGKAVFQPFSVNVNKTNLNISTAALATFELVNGAHVVGSITGSGITQVASGASLTATSITQGTLTIDNGATVTIQPIPGGPLSATITPVPEPSTLALLAGVLMLPAYARARRK